MSKSISLIEPSNGKIYDANTLKEGIKWKWSSTGDYTPWMPNGNSFVTPIKQIPHQYIGGIKMQVKDESGGVIYEKEYDCLDPKFNSFSAYDDNKISYGEWAMYFMDESDDITSWALWRNCIDSMRGADWGTMHYWNPPMSLFEPGKTYYWNGEVKLIPDFSSGEWSGGNDYWCQDTNEPAIDESSGQCFCMDDRECQAIEEGYIDHLYLTPGEEDVLDTKGIMFQFEEQISGCMDPEAENFNENANIDDESCTYPEPPPPEENDYPFADNEEPVNNQKPVAESPPQDPGEQVPEFESEISPTPKIGNISSRVFGSDIQLAVKRKLELRQKLNNRTIDPNKPITTSHRSDTAEGVEFISLNDENLGMDLQFNGAADLSSRTPVARMWTAVQLERVTKKRTWNVSQDKNYTRKPEYRYETKGRKVIEKEINKFDRMIYMLGDANEDAFGYSANEMRTGTEIEGGLGKDLLPTPNESNNNQFLKPPAGITGVSSETEGPLGTIRKTEVEFVVHNFHDFDKIYSRYFLRPGALIFVDFGWSSQDLYDPKELVFDEFKKEPNIEDGLYGPNGVITRAAGDMETFMGYVVDFSAKATDNGSFECSVEIVSKNQALIGHSFKDKQIKKNRLIASLDAKVMNYAAKHFGNEFLEEGKSYAQESAEEWSKVAYRWAQDELGDSWKVPGTIESRLLGVYWKKLSHKNKATGERKNVADSSKNIYICWGLFEDLILNNELSLGDEKDETGKALSAIFDSSNSFVHFDRTLHKAQKAGKHVPFVFLYPRRWDESFNGVRGKVPSDRKDSRGNSIKLVPENNPYFKKYGTPGKELSFSTLDKNKLHRIPMREIFVNLATIKEGLQRKDKVKDIVQYILDAINDESGGIYDLQLSTAKKHMSEISVQDRNYILADRMGGSQDLLDKLFVFKPHSENTIVQEFDVSFKMPDNNMNNMIAIQAADAGTTIFAADRLVDQALALNIQKYMGADNLGVAYMPQIGNGPANRMEKNQSQAMVIDSGFYDVGDMLKGDDKTANAFLKNFKKSPRSNDDKEAYKEALDNARNYDKQDETTKSDSTISTENDTPEADEYNSDVQLASTKSDYFLLKSKSDYFSSQISTIIPIEVELTIYGIGLINVGDLFRVDYLPKNLLESVYFQVTKVGHEVDTSGWKTSLTTQMRVSPVAKQKFPLYKKAPIYLSRKALISEHGSHLQGDFYCRAGDPETLGDSTKWMREIDIDNSVKFLGNENTIPHIYKFKSTVNKTITQPFKRGSQRGVGGTKVTYAMSWKIKEKYPKVTWKITGSHKFKTWSKKGPPGSELASGPLGAYMNYGLFYKIELKEDEMYRLFIDNDGDFLIAPMDLTAEQYDLIDQGYYAMHRKWGIGYEDDGWGKKDYDLPRPAIAERVSE